MEDQIALFLLFYLVFQFVLKSINDRIGQFFGRYLAPVLRGIELGESVTPFVIVLFGDFTGLVLCCLFSPSSYHLKERRIGYIAYIETECDFPICDICFEPVKVFKRKTHDQRRIELKPVLTCRSSQILRKAACKQPHSRRVVFCRFFRRRAGLKSLTCKQIYDIIKIIITRSGWNRGKPGRDLRPLCAADLSAALPPTGKNGCVPHAPKASTDKTAPRSGLYRLRRGRAIYIQRDRS